MATKFYFYSWWCGTDVPNSQWTCYWDFHWFTPSHTTPTLPILHGNSEYHVAQWNEENGKFPVFVTAIFLIPLCRSWLVNSGILSRLIKRFTGEQACFVLQRKCENKVGEAQEKGVSSQWSILSLYRQPVLLWPSPEQCEWGSVVRLSRNLKISRRVTISSTLSLTFFYIWLHLPENLNIGPCNSFSKVSYDVTTTPAYPLFTIMPLPLYT